MVLAVLVVVLGAGAAGRGKGGGKGGVNQRHFIHFPNKEYQKREKSLRAIGNARGPREDNFLYGSVIKAKLIFQIQ